MNDDIIEIDETTGMIYNRTLQEDWKRYFELEEEIPFLKQELLERSLRSKAKGHKIPGVIIKNGSYRINKKGIETIFKNKGWPLIKIKRNDFKAMKEKLILEGITVPRSEQSPTAYKHNKR